MTTNGAPKSTSRARVASYARNPMSAEPSFSAAITPAASGAGITFAVKPILRSSSRTRSGTGPVVSPVVALTRPWTGLLPRNTPRSVPAGASVEADGEAGGCAATGSEIRPTNTAAEKRLASTIIGLSPVSAWRILSTSQNPWFLKRLQPTVAVRRWKPMDSTKGQTSVLGLWGVRYQVSDVQRSIAFYTQTLGFTLDRQNLPAFGQVSVGNLKLILSGPGASGSRPMPDGHRQEPGGWNRIVLHITDLAAFIEQLRSAGIHFRNEMEVGPHGRQIQLEDPDGNPIELFEPAQ